MRHILRGEQRSGNAPPIGKAALAKGVSEDLFDRVVNPLALTRGGSADLPDPQKS